jgi:hypothetical protein
VSKAYLCCCIKQWEKKKEIKERDLKWLTVIEYEIGI